MNSTTPAGQPMLLLRRSAGACLMPLIQQAARAYVAGDRRQDALAVCQRLRAKRISTTLGYFNEDHESPARVERQYLSALHDLTGTDDYLSIKLPALQFDAACLQRLAEQATRRQVRIHCDSLDEELADRTRDAIEALLRHYRPALLGYTLPGRWRRSIEDAHWACRLKIPVRVVKGQWPDPADPQRDLRNGFLEVIDALAGRAAHVSVASHDVPTAEEALRRLRRAGTPCDMELLFGLPMRASLAMAKPMRVPVRVYVPYGKTHLPYAIARLRQNPRMAWWLMKDLLLSAFR